MVIDILYRRILQLFSVMLVVGVLSFLIMHSLPGDMAYRIAAGRYGQDNVSMLAAQQVAIELNLDAGLVESLMYWFNDLIRFNFGTSLVSGQNVSDMLYHQVGHSLVLAISAVLIALLISIPFGLLSVKYPRILNPFISLISVLTKSMPVFVIGIVLIAIFAIELNLAPVAGYGSWQYLLLPAFTLGISLAAVTNRVIYVNALDVSQSAFYQFSRFKGLTVKQTLLRHGVKNISAPVVTYLGIQLVIVIEGIVMIESLFSWPGIGHGLAHAIFARDVPVIQGCALMMGFLFVAVNTITDLICYKLDPRGLE
ncbi:ABC transporter permease [Shewanella maritima]|uniref:ABC transporter permease n=1 Tax=Shewanella maritima TaxID=2520507 RepID=A0A411PM74_9GAMM|nr:ABC transporter permease [Shewanella maritima]QBF84601.1 ABC transporter permease [Shewanella maritima]